MVTSDEMKLKSARSMPVLEHLLDQEIAFWRRQTEEAKTDAWLVAYGIVAGLKKAREIIAAGAWFGTYIYNQDLGADEISVFATVFSDRFLSYSVDTLRSSAALDEGEKR